jgi:hypothetical protein
MVTVLRNLRHIDIAPEGDQANLIPPPLKSPPCGRAKTMAPS